MKPTLTQGNIIASTEVLRIAHQYVAIEDVVMLEGDSNYTKVWLKNGKKILCAKTLKSYQESLQEPFFVRIHKKTVINLHYLLSFDTHNCENVSLKTGKTLEISRRRKTHFRKVVEAFTAI
jgi:two-component system, LytTR family, response regulator